MTPTQLHSATFQHYHAVLGSQSAMPTTVMPDTQAFAIMDGVTAPVVLEDIARGYLVTEIAIAYGVPQLAFRRWIALRVPPHDLKAAVKACADAFIARAMAVMSVSHRSSDERSAMSALAKQMVSAAACMSPDDWMPNRISGGADPMAPPLVINVLPPETPPQPLAGPGQQAFQTPTVGVAVVVPNPAQGIPMSVLSNAQTPGPSNPLIAGSLPPTAANTAPKK